jgi:hypothetical protein
LSSTFGPDLWTCFEAQSDHDSAVASTTTWLESLPVGLSGDVLEESLAADAEGGRGLADTLRRAGLDVWAARIVAAGADKPSLAACLGNALIFRAGLRFAIGSDRDDLLEVSGAALRTLRHTEHSASAMFGAMLVADDAGVGRLERALDQIAANAQTAPDRLAWSGRPSELAPVAPTTQLLWSTFHGHALPHHFWAYDALRAIPAAYGRRLHALPVGLAHTIVDLARDMSVEELTAIIVAAPPAFSPEGRPIASGALYALLEKTQRALNDAERVGDTANGQRVIDAVVSREDGPWLGRTWHQRLQWALAHRSASLEREWPAQALAALSDRLAPLVEDEGQAWIHAEALDSWRGDRVLVEASIHLAHHDGRAAAELLAWSLRENVVTSTGRDPALNTGSWESNVIQNALAAVELGPWFTEVWTNGYARRERARIGSHHRVGEETARVALAWGLCAANGNFEGRRPPWPEIAAALREVRLMDPHFTLFGDFGSRILRYASALCVALIKRGELTVQDQADLLDLLIEPTSDFGGWLWMMIEQDEPLTRSAASIVGKERVRRALEMGVLRAGTAQPKLAAEVMSRITEFAQTL